MAALPLRASWSPGPAVAPAPRSTPPIRGAMSVLPLGRRGRPSSAPIRMQAHPRDVFRPRCQKGSGQYPQSPEPERGDAEEPDAAESSEDPGLLLSEKLDKYCAAYRAAMGERVAPDMFLKEKDQISNYMMKMSSPGADILNVNAMVLAQIVCARAQTALDLASKIMDIASFELGRTEISQQTANQMIRTYAAIFCNVSEDVYHKRVKMEAIISFLDALRGLGAVCHILVGGKVAKLEDCPLKDSITCHMDTLSREFEKKVNDLKEKFTLATRIHAHKIVTNILFDGTNRAESYVFRLVQCHRAALPHIQSEE